MVIHDKPKIRYKTNRMLANKVLLDIEKKMEPSMPESMRFFYSINIICKLLKDEFVRKKKKKKKKREYQH